MCVALQVRDPRAGYLQTLSVLKAAKECGVYTKSSIMLGLGETGELGDEGIHCLGYCCSLGACLEIRGKRKSARL